VEGTANFTARFSANHQPRRQSRPFVPAGFFPCQGLCRSYEELILADSVWTYSHWVRITSFPICSAVVPGKDSYSERPMAKMGIFRLVDASFRNVRYGHRIPLIDDLMWKTMPRTRTRAGKNPLCKDILA
jgi:hypothetical protein